jgi:hypothetical protein
MHLQEEKRTNETWKEFYKRWKKERGTVLDHVLQYLPLNDLSHVAAVCHATDQAVNDQAHDEITWKERCGRKFGAISKLEGLTWKESYQIWLNCPEQRPNSLNVLPQNSKDSLKKKKRKATKWENEVKSVCDVTGIDAQQAAQLLDTVDGNIELAINLALGL